MVHSRATDKYTDDWIYDKKMVVRHHPERSILKLKDTEDSVIAIGGGSVIDTAKIISKNPIIAIPTTFAGACRTSHAVYWEGTKKFDVDTPRPITITKPEYLETLPERILQNTKVDCLCHAIESLISKKATRLSRFYASTSLSIRGTLAGWLNASLLAGDAMEITGTNVIHALSYPVTAIYKVPHGKALAFFLPKLLSYYSLDININGVIKEEALNMDIDIVIKEALTYPKIHETVRPINKKILLRLLE